MTRHTPTDRTCTKNTKNTNPTPCCNSHRITIFFWAAEEKGGGVNLVFFAAVMPVGGSAWLLCVLAPNPYTYTNVNHNTCTISYTNRDIIVTTVDATWHSVFCCTGTVLCIYHNTNYSLCESRPILDDI